ncbi:MAG: site-specific DNA-methyltransferase [Candidatus Saccharicenans sp.]|nr:site-specific DNA-methyltransferase [Candidatus Saccharicenans sp.]
MKKTKARAPRNRTIKLTEAERHKYRSRLLRLNGPVSLDQAENRTICQDVFEVLDCLPSSFVDLAFVDPPYNLNKTFNLATFREMESDKYESWLESWLKKLRRLLKPTASIYICGDWKSSGAIFNIIRKHFRLRNRITWEREKGRGARRNWKNCSEDIWFATVSDDYYFNLEAVKLKRRVLAPYRDPSGRPRDWSEETTGRYRVTHPSNLWSDLTVPFWSMPENTDHPTQKPEKLLARIILASSRVGDLVFDPFLGSGTTSVVAKKLGRRYLGVEIDEYYCCLAEKRLELAERDKTIQGYEDGVFWERNTLADRKLMSRK